MVFLKLFLVADRFEIHPVNGSSLHAVAVEKENQELQTYVDLDALDDVRLYHAID